MTSDYNTALLGYALGTLGYIQRIEYDGSDNPIYVGIALPGSLGSEEVWQIKRITYDGSNNATAVNFAGSTAEFKFAWDDRTSLSYG